MKETVELRDIRKFYEGKAVLNGFSLSLPPQSSTCLMGASGCGKTTLLRILLGLEQADGGEIILPENTRVSCVFQENRLIQHLSAFENCRLVCSDGEAIADLLRRLGLGDSMAKPVRELSGGMARRVALARALLAPFDLLLLDEAFKGLDEETRRAAAQTVKQYCRGKTVLAVTHDEREAELLGARIVRLG